MCRQCVFITSIALMCEQVDRLAAEIAVLSEEVRRIEMNCAGAAARSVSEISSPTETDPLVG